MIFPSYVFLLLFLPGVLLGWYGLRQHHRARLSFLTVMSYVFYGWWDPRFTLLMLASTGLDFVCGARIAQATTLTGKRRWLGLSLAGNLGALGFFKYHDWFMGSVQAGLGALGLEVSLPVLGLILPIGISFYTFQSLSYSIDIYMERCRPTPSLLTFAAYVSMFPQLVAGPIVRYRDVEEQLEALPGRAVDPGQLADGVWLFTLGLLKKLWIADALAPAANYAFDTAADPGLVTCWLGTLAYTFQLYFDFSGYSDMALGLGKMLGFEFPINFDSPYKSASIAEFWRRWHISLSSWLRDYLFIPLGGSRHGMRNTVRNLVITMFLGGLWHGAAWTFVAWGLLHGALLGVGAWWRAKGPGPLRHGLAVALTFAAVTAGWVLFRAPDFARAGELFAGLVGLNGVEAFVPQTRLGIPLPDILDVGATPISRKLPIYLGLAAALAFCAPNTNQLPRPRGVLWAVALALALVASLTQLLAPTPFLYFQF